MSEQAPSEQVPSAERREEVLALQRQARKIARQIATDHFGSEPMIAFPFENRCQELIFAALRDLDAQHAERTRAEVEKASGHGENARLFREAVVRSCDETLGRQKHEIRALTEQFANTRAEMREYIAKEVYDLGYGVLAEHIRALPIEGTGL